MDTMPMNDAEPMNDSEVDAMHAMEVMKAAKEAAADQENVTLPKRPMEKTSEALQLLGAGTPYKNMNK